MREQAHRTAEVEHDKPQTATEEESEHTTRFSAGNAPPVGGSFHDQPGTATLAYEEDANQRELKEKVSALVAKKFGGDYKKAFEHYDKHKNGSVGKSELVELLSEAGVGNSMTRGIWANKIIDKLDTTGDRSIQWGEFESVFHGRA